jgi:serine/threonine-protein kinase HipA
VRKLEVRFTRTPDESWPVGTLAEDHGRVYFAYAPEFLTRNLNLSPLRLPFQSDLFEHLDRDFGPLPGLFDDSLPDGWGLLLMDRYFRQRRMNPLELTALDRVAFLGTRTMGALTYHPPADQPDLNSTPLSLHDLARQSEQVLAGTAAEVLPQLLRAGGSPGGARPKVLVGLRDNELLSGADDLPAGYTHWIVKFPAKDDPPDAGPLEYAYALMARAAGITMPPTRLFQTPQGERFFGVQRFDRGVGGGNRRFHVHTFGNLIQSNFRIPAADYAQLLEATAALTRNHQDVLQAFRRMVFNVAAHNRDDHVKNFAFIMDDATGDWRLSPAYDLTLTPGPGGWHSMTVMGEGQNPERPHMLQLAEQVSIPTQEANEIITEVQDTVAHWHTVAAQAHVSKETRRLVETAVVRL